MVGDHLQALVSKLETSTDTSPIGGPVVAFTPDDLDVIKGGPDGRRAFLDRAVFNRFPAYLRESRAYTRALKGRNRLLKERVAPDYLETWDQTLATTGARLWTRRRALLTELAPRAVNAFAAIGRTADPARYEYEPSHVELDFASADEAALAKALHEALVTRRPRDLERGFTSVGPHTDDLEIRLGERLARGDAGPDRRNGRRPRERAGQRGLPRRLRAVHDLHAAPADRHHPDADGPDIGAGRRHFTGLRSRSQSCGGGSAQGSRSR